MTTGSHQVGDVLDLDHAASLVTRAGRPSAPLGDVAIRAGVPRSRTRCQHAGIGVHASDALPRLDRQPAREEHSCRTRPTDPTPPRSSPRALRERILVLDGAMGTADPAAPPDEADYRGERFADWASDLKGNNDLLTLTQPDIIARHPPRSTSRPAPTSSRPTPSPRTRISQADYGMQDLAYELNRAGRAARPRGGRRGRARPDRPRYVAGALGPTNRTASISPDVNDPGARNVSYDELVGGLPRAGPRPGRRRRRPAAGRDDLRHPQRQGRDLRPRDALRGARPPLAGDHLRHHHRRLRPHPVRPGHRGVLELRAPRPAARRRPQLRARRRRDAALRRRAAPARRHASSPATPTPACPTRSASTTRRPTRWPRCIGEFAEQRPGQPRRRLLRHHPGAHRGDRRPRSRARRRATPAEPASGDAAVRPRAVQRSPRTACSSTSASAPTSPARPGSAT